MHSGTCVRPCDGVDSLDLPVALVTGALKHINLEFCTQAATQIFTHADLAVDQAAIVPRTHHQVEVGAVLKGEDDPDEVVVGHLVLPDKEGALEVHAGHLGGADGDAGGAVHLLADLLALVLELPLRLRLAPRVLPHGDRLHRAEVGSLDPRVLRTRIELVRHRVAVKVSEAGVADAVLVGVLLAGIGQEGTVVGAVGDAVAVGVVIAVIALAVAVNVQLIGIVIVRAVVRQVGNAVKVAVKAIVTGVACFVRGTFKGRV